MAPSRGNCRVGVTFQPGTLPCQNAWNQVEWKLSDMAKSSPTSTEYTGKLIRVLEGLEPVRKRPGMYIGSTDSKGLHHCVKEIVDNSVDEGIVGFASEISLYVRDDGYITVTDNGRGIPVDMHPSGVSALEVAMTKLHAGGKFDEMAYQASGGLHGVGASAVNALSTHMQVVVNRGETYYYQEYHIGNPVAAVRVITEKEVLEKFPLEGPDFVKYPTGTLSNFTPDATIFSTTKYSVSTLKDFLRERAYLMAGLYFRLFDGENNVRQDFYFEGGIRSMVHHMNMNKKQIHSVVHTKGEYKSEKFPILVEVAMQYTDTYTESIEMFANTIKTPDGGTHLTGFRMALNKSLKDYATSHGLFKDDKDTFTAEDLKEGMTAVIFVKMPSDDLQFESQTKAKLNNSEAQSAVYQVVKEGLDEYLEENPSEAKAMVEKVLLAARARLAARAAKDAVIRKGALEGMSLPGKLADCQSKNPEESEIFIVEGDSAGGCFAGDTQVALADGRNVSFKQLVEEQAAGKEHFGYTIRHDGTIGIERILHARITKHNAEVLKITLDNGEEIICTPDHKFMLRDGSYLQAKDLTPADSLMPLYRKLSDKSEPGITIDGYEMAWDPRSDSWLYTHVLADWYNRWQGAYTKESGEHCHHVDFNKRNNNPTNIQRISKEDHLALHRKHVSQTLHRPDVIEKSRAIHQSADFRQKMSTRMQEPSTRKILSEQAKQQWKNPEYKRLMGEQWLDFYHSNADYRQENARQLQAAQEQYWSDEDHRQQQAQRTTRYFANHPEARIELSIFAKEQWQDPQLLSWRKAKTSEQWTNDFRQKRHATLQKTYYRKTLQALKKFEVGDGQVDISAYNQYRAELQDKSLLRFDTFTDRYFAGEQGRALEAIHLFNHKIVSIERLSQRIDVYDIEVPHTHNFALASGIFVHNSAKQGRDRKFQAIFPLRGKILNTERARLDKIVAFEELKNLIIALGTGIGDTYDASRLRYHRIVLMNDADVDGEHITTLGLTFFYRHMPEILEGGHLYIAMPPLYKIENKKETFYAFSDAEKDQRVKELKSKYPALNIKIQRYKGLGEMNPEQLWETTMRPESRVLKQVTIEDAQKADQIFTTLMGSLVPPRKKFIQTHAKLATLDV